MQLARRGRLLSLATAVLLAACQSPASPSLSVVLDPSAPDGSAGPVASDEPGTTPRPGADGILTSSYAPAKGKDGGTVTIGDVREANQFNPYYLDQQTDTTVASAVWASLVIATADGRLAPDLAAEIPTTTNGGVRVPGDGGDAMTVSWTLRDGLAWSDGTPLTCGDFRYAWEWVLDPANLGVLTAGFENITAFDCPTPTTMVWHFDRFYEAYLVMMIAPLPRHRLAAIPMSDQTIGVGFRPAELVKLPVSGAFRFESVAPGNELRLVRNPHYRSSATGKPAHLERLVWRWYADADALIAAYRAGDVQVATGLGDAALPKLARLGKQVKVVPARSHEVLRPNWSAETCSTNVAVVAGRGAGCPASDPALRAAIAQAIDRAEVARLGGGAPVAGGTIVPPSSWFAADVPAPAFDPQEARRILDRGGWTVAPGGIRVKDGRQARLELCTTAGDGRDEVAALIAARLAEVGIVATPNAVAAEDMFADRAAATRSTPCAVARGNFDLALVAADAPADPLDAFFRYHSSQVPPKGANDTSVADSTIDAALRTVQESADLATIREAMAVFQSSYVEQTVEIPLYVRRDVTLVGPKLGNVLPGATRGGPTWNAVDWFVK